VARVVVSYLAGVDVLDAVRAFNRPRIGDTLGAGPTIAVALSAPGGKEYRPQRVECQPLRYLAKTITSAVATTRWDLIKGYDYSLLRRPQRDSNSKTGDHGNINRGAALRCFVSDSWELRQSALGRGGVGCTVAFPAVVARAWQKPYSGAPLLGLSKEGEQHGEGASRRQRRGRFRPGASAWARRRLSL
jgi:hypothetical protein